VNPVSRRELIRRLRRLGFTGLFAGSKHEHLMKGERTVPVPNVHRGDISVRLLRIILREASVSQDEWEQTQ